MALSNKQIVVPLTNEEVKTRLSLLSLSREGLRLSPTPSSALYQLQRTLFEERECGNDVPLFLVMLIEVKDTRSKKQGVVTHSASHTLGAFRVSRSLRRHVEQPALQPERAPLPAVLALPQHALLRQLLRP